LKDQDRQYGWKQSSLPIIGHVGRSAQVKQEGGKKKDAGGRMKD
jgi:hypothetical protein